MSIGSPEFEENVSREAVRLIGDSLPPLEVFSTEEYLQRQQLQILENIGQAIGFSQSKMPVGTRILKDEREILEERLESEGRRDAVLRANAQAGFFACGFGLVEKLTTLDPDYTARGARGSQVYSVYQQWRTLPFEGRAQEMRAYLERNNADLLANNLFETDHPGYIINNLLDTMQTSTLRVNGEDPFILEGRHPDAAYSMQEGILAALYVLREEYTYEEMERIDLKDIRLLREYDPGDQPTE